MRGAAMSLTAAASGFVTLLLTIPVVRAHDDWGVTCGRTEICALKGSVLEISCTYIYPSTVERVTDKFWFTKMSNDVYTNLKNDKNYSGRVHYNCSNNHCILRITDVRESDSAVYKFRFITNQHGGKYTGKPGVTLSITDLQVLVSRSEVSRSDNWAVLKCHSSCQLGHVQYVWYENGRNIQRETSYSYSAIFNTANSYSCAVKGYEKFASPPVYAPKLPHVSVSPSGEIMEGRSVTLTCSSDAKPAATYTWYKRYQLLHTSEPQLVLGSIQPSDSGEYYCAAENELGRKSSAQQFIEVTYAPKRTSVSVSPSGEIIEGTSVNLTCSSDAKPAATYTWFNGSQKLVQGSEGVYRFISISSEDRGTYYCKSENQHGSINSNLLIDVRYAPKLPSVSVSPSGEIMEGSSVTLTCTTDANPAANYTWYKESQKLHRGQERTYYFNSICSEDSGKYFCRSENQYGKIDSSSLDIDVQYAPKLPSVSVSPSAEIVEGSSLTLTCSSDANPAANYTWYKKDEDFPKASGQTFTIAKIRAEHRGDYYCEAQNKRGRQNSTLHTVAVSPSVWKSAIIGTTPAVFLAIIWLSVFLLIRTRKQRAATQSSEPGGRPDNREQGVPNQSEEQDELHYASIYFSRNQTDPVYSNIRAAGHLRHKEEEEEEEVEYAAVKFNSGSSSPRAQRPEAEEDTAALYSAVNKTTEC